MHPRSIPALLAASLAARAIAGVSYSEALDGELSDNRLQPTSIALSAGLNTITGSFGPSAIPDIPDLDYLTIAIPPGLRLDRVILRAADVCGAFSFIGIEAGPVVSVQYTTFDASGLMGWTHFGTADAGQDLMEAISSGPGSMGFTPPIPGGIYTLWIMELDGARPYHYTFELVVGPASCPADLTGDGIVDFSDYLDFLNRYDALDPSVDFNGDGLIDFADYLEFLNRYEAGC